MMISLQTVLKPLLTVTAATLGSLTFTSLIDCQPSLFVWDRWHRILNHNNDKNDPPKVVADFYKDKNVWIIGASSGIGQEMALQLARTGCANLILSARQETRLHQVAQQCREVAAIASSSNNKGFQCHCQVLDILSTKGSEDLEARFEDVLQNQLPALPIDIVVFNAGAGQLQPSLETPAKAIQRIMDVNALWSMILTPLLFKHGIFRSHQRDETDRTSTTTTTTTAPHIVVTNSIAAQLPVPLSAVYAASKAAQAHYFASLVAEQAPGSIRVDVLCPGPIDTDFHQNHAKIMVDGKSTSNNSSKTVATTSTSTKRKPPRTKMAVDQCVRLMVAATAKKTRSGYQEIWIAPRPLISVMFLQRLFPGLFQRLTTKFGQKRVQLWREGKDLYDPKSW
eukprot:scaffold7227_cov160-Amphora_coffeaeformis.AAC.7